MKLLFAASEANPYAASGGLGDVMGALPLELSKNKGYDVSVILPLYDTMKEVYRDQLEKVVDISFNLSWRSTGATIYKIKNGKVTYYFVENHYYFDRGRLYGEMDDGERFAFFSTAVVEFMLQTNNIPDVFHANDWQTALAVIYLKTKYASIEALKSIRTVYTIHNIEFQGKYNLAILGDVFALDGQYENDVEFNGDINLMKGALVLSDYVTTVSPNYANELKHDFFAFGLAEVIKSISHKMTGVINGIDYNYFSPVRGGDIDFPYNAHTLNNGKIANKLALQKELGLEENADIPLVVMISRLADGKGIDLVTHIADEFLNENVQLVVLGTGDKKLEQEFLDIQERHANCKALIKFDRVISKKMYASADIFLMPSKSEPCGLAQMIACSYGTIPVVRAVGGLYDSIIPYCREDSNGFTFNNYNAHELLYTLKNALALYNNKQEWKKLRKRAISSDFSWKVSAQKYIELYNKSINW